MDLEPQTVEAFSRYVEVTEARIAKELARPGAFLYLEEMPEAQRSKTLASFRKGEIYLEQLHAHAATGAPLEAPGGLIHDWFGAVFLPEEPCARSWI